MMSTDQRLAYMADQIFRNLAGMGPKAAAATADHITNFWAPSMRDRALAMLDDPGAGLTAGARAALEQLRLRSH